MSRFNFARGTGNGQIGTRFSGGFRDTSPPPTQAQFSSAMNAALQERMRIVEELLEVGEPYFLNVALGIPAGAAVGDQNTVITNNQDFNLLVVGASCDLFRSSLSIIDSSRNKLITNGNVPIPAIANVVNATVQIQEWDWTKPYLLPAKAIFSVTWTCGHADDQDGQLTFRCLQPPVTY